MADQKKLPPVLFFIFGGSGDLNYRKLTPGFYNLFLDELCLKNFQFMELPEQSMTDDAYKQHLKEGIDNFSRKKDDAKWNDFASHIRLFANGYCR